MGDSQGRKNMMKIKKVGNDLKIAVGEVKLRKKSVDIEEFPQLFKMFVSFEEGYDWRRKKDELIVRHPNLAEIALVYLSLRSADASAEKSRKFLNSLRMFEASSLASILLYRLSIIHGRNGKFMRSFGKAVLKMFMEG